MTLSMTILGGLALVSTAAMLTTQGASVPVKSSAEYFVTSEGDDAHLWVREGNALRVVAHGSCKACPLHGEEGHAEGDGHDHGKHDAKK